MTDPIRETPDGSAASPAAEPAAAPQQGAPEPGAVPDQPDLVQGEQADDSQLPDGGGVEELRSALAEAERLRDEYLDQAQRGRAEYLNLKRRSDEALAAALDRGAERLVSQLLGVLDNFGYVVDAADEAEEGQLAKGVQMVYRELLGVLEAAGLERVPGVGATFDPQVHEALLSEESPEPVDEPVVTEVLRPGYRFKGRTLRAAAVKVAR